MSISEKTKKNLVGLGVAGLAIWLSVLTVGVLGSRPDAEGFQSGGAIALGGAGGGLAKVTNAAGILSGSGTPGNPETATLTVGSGLGGAGSSGNAIHTALSIGSGLAGNGSSSNLTTSLMVGSGLAGNGSSTNLTTSLNVGSGLGGTGSSSPLTTSLMVGSGLAGNGSNTNLTTSLNIGTAISGNGSSTPLAVNVTTASCSNGRGVTAIDASGTGTCGNVQANAYGGTYFSYDEEFNNSAANSSSAFGGGLWSSSVTGTGATTESIGTTTRTGILNCNSGTTASSRCSIMAAVNNSGGAGTSGLDFGSLTTSNFEWVGGLSALNADSASSTATYVFLVGFLGGNGSFNQSYGCFFVYDHTNVITNGANSGHADSLECVCASGGTRTVYLINGSGNSDESFALGTAAVGAVTLPNTNVYRLKVAMTAATRAEFYYNNTKVCDINTHIPSGATGLVGHGLMVINGASGTTAFKAENDWMHLDYTLSGSRSP